MDEGARDTGALLERVRALLADRPSVREVAMFGGRSFMVDDAMLVHVRRTGHLLVRVDPDRSAELVERGARPAEMGAGRTMGPGWLDVPAEQLVGERLGFWVGVASPAAAARRRRARR